MLRYCVYHYVFFTC